VVENGIAGRTTENPVRHASFRNRRSSHLDVDTNIADSRDNTADCLQGLTKGRANDREIGTGPRHGWERRSESGYVEVFDIVQFCSPASGILHAIRDVRREGRAATIYGRQRQRTLGRALRACGS
jgi:hypothetical protein